MFITLQFKYLVFILNLVNKENKQSRITRNGKENDSKANPRT